MHFPKRLTIPSKIYISIRNQWAWGWVPQARWGRQNIEREHSVGFFECARNIECLILSPRLLMYLLYLYYASKSSGWILIQCNFECWSYASSKINTTCQQWGQMTVKNHLLSIYLCDRLTQKPPCLSYSCCASWCVKVTVGGGIGNAVSSTMDFSLNDCWMSVLNNGSREKASLFESKGTDTKIWGFLSSKFLQILERICIDLHPLSAFLRLCMQHTASKTQFQFSYNTPQE